MSRHIAKLRQVADNLADASQLDPACHFIFM